MGQALDKDGHVLGEAYGATKQEVFDKLNTAHQDAEEIRIRTMRPTFVRDEHIAAIVHEANRAYCVTIGDMSQPPWADAPQWQKDSAINGVIGIRNGTITRPEQSHESWLEEKRRTGWRYGPVKNADKKEHPCFVPYDQLPPEQQRKDALFFAIVNALK